MIGKILIEINRLKNELDGYSAKEGLDYIKSYINTLSKQQVKEPDKSLEEAAIDFADNARKQLFTKDYAISSIADYDHGCIDGFKAGAEWQARQLLQGSPMPEDTVLFNKGVQEGRRLEREDMLKEATEGEVYLYHSYNRDATAILVDIPKENLGDKVRIVVLKAEEE